MLVTALTRTWTCHKLLMMLTSKSPSSGSRRLLIAAIASVLGVIGIAAVVITNGRDGSDSNHTSEIQAAAGTEITATWSTPDTPTTSPYFFYTITFSDGVEGLDAGDFSWDGAVTNCLFTPSKATLAEQPSQALTFADYPTVWNLFVRCKGTGSFTPYVSGTVGIEGDTATVAPGTDEDIAARTVEVQSFPTLTMTKNGSGTGYVRSSTSSFQCGVLCTATFPPSIYGTAWSVTLAALPDPGSFFVGWSGSCTGTATCKLTMTTSRWVTATFERGGGIVVTKFGLGTVASSPAKLNCPISSNDPCMTWFKSGTVVTLTATPPRGKRFIRWAGACNGPGSCVIQADAANKDPIPVYAIFE